MSVSVGQHISIYNIIDSEILVIIKVSLMCVLSKVIQRVGKCPLLTPYIFSIIDLSSSETAVVMNRRGVCRVCGNTFSASNLPRHEVPCAVCVWVNIRQFSVGQRCVQRCVCAA